MRVSRPWWSASSLVEGRRGALNHSAVFCAGCPTILPRAVISRHHAARNAAPGRDGPAPRHGKSMATLIELEHLHNETDAALGALTEAIDTFWTLSMAIVILLMQAGFAMLEAGAVRERSVRDILLKNTMDVSVCAMIWAAFGSMLASDTHGPFLGWRVLPNDTATPFEAIDVAQGEDMSIYFLGYLYAATSSTIVSGAIAERTQQRAYIILSCAMAGLIYPGVVHWVWTDRGWLSWTNEDAVLGGAYDFAGASVVHLTGGARPPTNAR